MTTVRLFGEIDDLYSKRGTGKGIHIISNGWCISAQAGRGNYCSVGDDHLTHHTIRIDCEIALWQVAEGDMIELEGDTVMGWVSWDVVFDFISWLRDQKTSPDTSTVRSKILELHNETII